MESPKPFSQQSHTLAAQIQLKVVNHPFYIELANGSLPLDKFKVFVEQDLIYLDYFHEGFKIAATKEDDPDLKAKLVRYSQGKSSETLLRSYCTEFGFIPRTILLSGTASYIKYIMDIAGQESPAVYFASIFPCIFLWHKLGNYLIALASFDLEKNPYKKLLQAISGPPEQTGLAKANGVVDTYWNQANDSEKKRMVTVFEYCIGQEMEFVESIYNTRQ